MVWLNPVREEPSAPQAGSVNGTANEHSALAAGGGSRADGVRRQRTLDAPKAVIRSAHDRKRWFAASDHGDKAAAIKGAIRNRN